MYEKFQPINFGKKEIVEVDIVKASDEDIFSIANLVSKRHKWPIQECIESVKKQLAQKGKYQNLKIFVAKSNNHVIGFSKINYFNPNDHEQKYLAPEGWYLAGIIINQKYRRLGVGTKLTKVRIEEVKKNTKKVYYFADSKNKTSIVFHEKLGFEFLTNQFSYPGCSFTEDNPPALFYVSL